MSSVINKIGVIISAIDEVGQPRFFLRKNSPFNGTGEGWNFIYGHIESGEDQSATVMREVNEETGLNGKKPADLSYTISKTFPDGRKVVISYWLVELDGLAKHVKLNNESIGFQWALADDVRKLIPDELQSVGVDKALAVLGQGVANEGR